MVPQQPKGDTVIRDLEVLDCQPRTRRSHCLLSLGEDPSPQCVVQVMLFSAAERKKTTCTQASTQRPRRTNSPSREGPRGTGAQTPRSVHLHPEWTLCSRPLRLLLKEVMIFLLLQFTVVLLDFPVGFFHVVIHELVHEWVKISLVTKEIDELGAIIKVACR